MVKRNNNNGEKDQGVTTNRLRFNGLNIYLDDEDHDDHAINQQLHPDVKPTEHYTSLLPVIDARTPPSTPPRLLERDDQEEGLDTKKLRFKGLSMYIDDDEDQNDVVNQQSHRDLNPTTHHFDSSLPIDPKKVPPPPARFLDSYSNPSRHLNSLLPIDSSMVPPARFLDTYANPSTHHLNSSILPIIDPRKVPPARFLDSFSCPPLEFEVQHRLPPPLFDLPAQSLPSDINYYYNRHYGRSDVRPLAVRTASYTKQRKPTKVSRKKEEQKPKSDTVDIPYLWATDRRAKVQDMKSLISSNIGYITGKVQCKNPKCKKQQYEVRVNLLEKFKEVTTFVEEYKTDMSKFERAEFGLKTCEFCEEDYCVVPVISVKKREINWLFLFLSQQIGHCTSLVLQYFCKHNGLRLTGLKKYLIFRTYLGLCKQLDPTGPYDEILAPHKV